MSTPLSTLSSAELESFKLSTQKSQDESFLQQTDQAIAGDTRETAKPHPRQAEFLALECEEALYGGAAGGGKTKGLLLWLAEGVHVPGFSGIFFRRTNPQLTRSNDSAIEQSFEIFEPLGGKFTSQPAKWRFPGGAMIDMSHMQYELNKWDHKGPSYHRICFDELTEFTESQYIYLRSRLRKHKGYPLTIGMRSGSNPDGLGRIWVMRRFITDEAMDSIKQLKATDPSPPGQVFYTPAGRAFMPSRVADNPTLDTDDYIQRLQGLGAVLAARLANGDWSITEGSLINPEWLMRYTMRGEHLVPLTKEGEHITSIHDIQCQRFATIDTAGTSKHKAEEDRGKPPSWSVCGVWDYWPQLKYLFLRHIWRARVDWIQLKNAVPKVLDEWHVSLALIESAYNGQALSQEIGSRAQLVSASLGGMKHDRIGNPLSAKQERARSSGFLGMLERGEFFLPDIATVQGVAEWLPDFEAELLGWTGRKEETADQIDVCSYAADHVRSESVSWGGVIDSRAVGRARW